MSADGRLDPEKVSAATLRRLFWQEGLTRLATKKQETGSKTRIRWQTMRPDALWHGDVCHGPTLVVGDRRTPVRVHALMDDHVRWWAFGSRAGRSTRPSVAHARGEESGEHVPRGANNEPGYGTRFRLRSLRRTSADRGSGRSGGPV